MLPELLQPMIWWVLFMNIDEPHVWTCKDGSQVSDKKRREQIVSNVEKALTYLGVKFRIVK